MDRVLERIGECKLSIHDLTMVPRHNSNALAPKHNMAIEAAISIGVYWSETKASQDKTALGIVGDESVVRESMSNFRGFDFVSHDNEPIKMCDLIFEWVRRLHGCMIYSEPPVSKLLEMFKENRDLLSENYFMRPYSELGYADISLLANEFSSEFREKLVVKMPGCEPEVFTN